MENFNENLDLDTLNLFKWMKNNDFDIETNTYLKLIVSENKNEGRCCISTKTYKPESSLLEVPVNFLISYRNALNNKELCEFFEWSSKNNNQEINNYKITRLDALYLLLILEKYDQNANLYYFIKTMPLKYDTVEYFHSSLIESYPDFIKQELIDRVDNLKEKFENISNLLKNYTKKFKENKSIQMIIENFSYESLRWAFCSVNSRCFHIKEEVLCDEKEIEIMNKYFGAFLPTDNLTDNYDEKFKRQEEMRNSLCCLIPFLDFLNHSFESNAYAYFDEEKRAYILKSQTLQGDDESGQEEEKIENLFNEQLYDSNSKRLVKKNDQVLITYGYHDNKTLLIEYGFLIESNTYDRIVFKKNDFMQFVENKNYFEFLWQKAGEHNFIEELTCNSYEGPSWFINKFFDIIVEINSKKSSEKDYISDLFQNYEIKNQNEIRIIYLKLLKLYKKDLSHSLTKINNLQIENDGENFSYHKSCSLKLIELHLSIIKFNIELANDRSQWNCMF